MRKLKYVTQRITGRTATPKSATYLNEHNIRSPMNDEINISYSIRTNGTLMNLSPPKVMGILNITPDSFYANSRKQTEKEIVGRALDILHEGGDIIDIGAYSSRPDATDVGIQEEMRRLRTGLSAIMREVPNAIVSVDTFRADVAAMCVEEYGVAIINDISAGNMDSHMFETVARLNVPYILTHMQGTPQTMQQAPRYDNLRVEVIQYFAEKIEELHSLGACDLIIDPGFGFGKTLTHNYELLAHLEDFKLLGCPLLAGVSRKSMIYNLLDITPDEALNGTTVVNTIALMKGVHILRVHDVKACTEAIKIYQAMNQQK